MQVETTDHLGKKYNTVKSMCDSYGITTSVYTNRKKLGWNLEKILTTPTKSREHEVIDHKGNKFTSISECAKYWNVSFRLLQKRLNNGWDIETAINTKSTKPESCQDHLGNIFDTKKEMCEHYNISLWTLRDRLVVQHMSLEKALTTSSQITDIFGNTFNSQKEMLKYYNCERETYKTRHRLNWSEIEALGLIPRIKKSSKNLELIPNHYIISHVDNNYYECSFNNITLILSYEQIINIMINKLKERMKNTIEKNNL